MADVEALPKIPLLSSVVLATWIVPTTSYSADAGELLL